MNHEPGRRSFFASVPFGGLACLALACLLVAWSTPPASAGMVIREKTVMMGTPGMPGGQQPGQKTRISTTYLQGKKIRTETGGRVFILDFDKGLLITVNPAKKIYTEMSLAELKKAQEQAMAWMGTLREEMEKKMQGMSPDQRAAMQKKLDSLPKGLFGDEKPAKITVKGTGKKKKIHGFPCKQYIVYEDGQATTEYWVTESVNTKIFDDYQKELGKWMAGMGPLGMNRLAEWDQMRGKGFPIKVVRLKPMFGKVSFDREVLSVEEKSLSKDLFTPPAGFTRKEAPKFPKMGQPGMGGHRGHGMPHH